MKDIYKRIKGNMLASIALLFGVCAHFEIINLFRHDIDASWPGLIFGILAMLKKEDKEIVYMSLFFSVLNIVLCRLPSVDTTSISMSIDYLADMISYLK